MTPLIEEESPPTRAILGIVLRGFLVLFAVVAVVACFCFARYLAQRRDNLAKLAAITAEIRASGEPLTAPEYDAYFALPATENDLTDDFTKAIQLLRAWKATTAQKQHVLWREAYPRPSEPWEHQPIAETMLRETAPILDALHQLADQDGRPRPPPLANGMRSLLDDWQSLRTGMLLLRCERVMQGRRGEHSAILVSLGRLLKLSQRADLSPFIVSQLTRLALVRLAISETAKAISPGKLTEAELVMLADAALEINLESVLERASLAERAACYTLVLQRPGMTPENETLSAFLDPLNSGPGATLLQSRPGDCALLLRQMTHDVAASRRPFPDVLKWAEQLEFEFKDIKEENSRLWPWERNVITETLEMHPVATASSLAEAIALRDALLTAIACERYALQHGDAPVELEDLVPEFLPAIPGDPFNGQALCRREDEFGYTIYSVGRDRIDQRGTLRSESNRELDVGVRIETPIDFARAP